MSQVLFSLSFSVLFCSFLSFFSEREQSFLSPEWPLFFLLAHTSSELDCTSRKLLLVIQFFTLFREQMESMLAKTLVPAEGVSLLTYILSTSTLSLVSSFKIFVSLERRVTLFVIAYSNTNGCNLEL